MVTTDFGFLGKGEVRATNGFIFGGNTQTDVYKFTTGTASLSVSAATSGFSNGDTFFIRLFRDTGNGTFAVQNDRLFGSSDQGKGTGEAFESLNTVLTQGTYFLVATGISPNQSIPYFTRIARASGTGQANPLANEEFRVGEISKDLQKRSRISDINTADNYAFTLDGSSSLNINVRELGNKQGDANIRVVQDLNGNGAVDKNEIVAKGISTLKGNLDTIAGLKGAGDYILQVCQSKGDTRFQVNFEHSPITA